MQVTSGIYRILSHPVVYEMVQNFFKTKQLREEMAARMNLKDGDKVLDVGCGPARILDNLPKVQYWGFDISEDYIQSAKEAYGDRGEFTCGIFNAETGKDLPQVDAILLSGLLHHLDDHEAEKLFQDCLSVLKPGGRIFTQDPVFAKGQNPIARYLISKDRGRNVRTPDEYKALVSDDFSDVDVFVTHFSFPPYSHCKMVLTR